MRIALLRKSCRAEDLRIERLGARRPGALTGQVRARNGLRAGEVPAEERVPPERAVTARRVHRAAAAAGFASLSLGRGSSERQL